MTLSGFVGLVIGLMLGSVIGFSWRYIVGYLFPGRAIRSNAKLEERFIDKVARGYYDDDSRLQAKLHSDLRGYVHDYAPPLFPWRTFRGFKLTQKDRSDYSEDLLYRIQRRIGIR
jgi:hypothetical protein